MKIWKVSYCVFSVCYCLLYIKNYYIVLQANVQRTVALVEQLQSVLLDYLVTSEGSNSILTDTLSIAAEKVTVSRLGENESKLKKCRFKPPCGAAFGLEESKLWNIALPLFLALGYATTVDVM